MSLLRAVERSAYRVRHSRALGNSEWLWRVVRPFYEGVIQWGGRRGLVRNLNGSDVILVHPRWRQTPEHYEPEIWRVLMDAVTKGDCVVDVGAWIGLHAVAFGKRVGPEGSVIALEPDPENRRHLSEHIRLNGVGETVTVLPVAAGDRTALVRFASDGTSQSHIEAGGASHGGDSAVCVPLDELLPRARVAVLKIDVEGYEEKVLAGAARLLADPERRPRLICVEVHPYAWADAGTTSESLLGALTRHGYEVRGTDGRAVSAVERYGHVFAVGPG
jgi:FkbM family methyltransferase